MTKLHHAAALSGILLALAGSGTARAAEPMAMDHATMAKPAASAPDGAAGADEAFTTANQAMMAGMDVKPTGDADRDFVAMMLPHHAGAIAMAKVELRYGKDPMLRKLATGIIKAQESEITEMQAWQKRHAR